MSEEKKNHYERRMPFLSTSQICQVRGQKNNFLPMIYVLKTNAIDANERIVMRLTQFLAEIVESPQKQLTVVRIKTKSNPSINVLLQV